MRTAATIILLLLLAFFVFLFAYLHMRQTERENRMLQLYMESMQSYYVSIQERIEAVRRYRHDLAKHIQTLELLLARHRESPNIQEYIEEIKEKYRAVQTRPYCENEIINAVCDLAARQCEEQEIPLSIQILDASYSRIKGADIAGLLHNLLENAIEASGKISDKAKRDVRLFMEEKDDHIFLEVSNQILPTNSPDFSTKKYPREEHGIGTKIIATLVAKYHGRQEYRTEKNCFAVRIWLFTPGRPEGETA